MHVQPCRDRLRRPDGKICDVDVLALLMEVKHYRSFVLRTKQLAGEFKRTSGVGSLSRLLRSGECLGHRSREGL
ncbi:hypothetical protein D3C87_1887930 [compost metagenome]